MIGRKLIWHKIINSNKCSEKVNLCKDQSQPATIPYYSSISLHLKIHEYLKHTSSERTFIVQKITSIDKTEKEEIISIKTPYPMASDILMYR